MCETVQVSRVWSMLALLARVEYVTTQNRRSG